MASKVSVTDMGQEEWDRAVARQLAHLQLTNDQLREMAAAGSFTSLAAKKLWLAIGPDYRGSDSTPP